MNAKAHDRRGGRWGLRSLTAVVTATCGCSHDGGSAAKAAGVHVPENFCSLLSASDISRVMGSAFPGGPGQPVPE